MQRYHSKTWLSHFESLGGFMLRKTTILWSKQSFRDLVLWAVASLYSAKMSWEPRKAQTPHFNTAVLFQLPQRPEGVSASVLEPYNCPIFPPGSPRILISCVTLDKSFVLSEPQSAWDCLSPGVAVEIKWEGDKTCPGHCPAHRKCVTCHSKVLTLDGQPTNLGWQDNFIGEVTCISFKEMYFCTTYLEGVTCISSKEIY